MKGKKDNVWSLDNELAQKEKERTGGRSPRGSRVVRRKRTKPGGGRVIVSGAMLMEDETVLQTQVLSFFLNLVLWGLWKVFIWELGFGQLIVLSIFCFYGNVLVNLGALLFLNIKYNMNVFVSLYGRSSAIERES